MILDTKSFANAISDTKWIYLKLSVFQAINPLDIINQFQQIS